MPALTAIAKQSALAIAMRQTKKEESDMSDQGTTSSTDRAKAMAEVLSKAGIFSDHPDLTHNPLQAARRAYSVVVAGATAEDFHNYLERMRADEGGVAFHRRLASVCRNALQSPEMPTDLVTEVTYALGYFEALSLTSSR